MSVFIDSYPSVNLKCDGCGLMVCVAKNQTDRLLIHDYIHENGWKTMKLKGEWVNFCPKCKEAYYEKRREKLLEKYV